MRLIFYLESLGRERLVELETPFKDLIGFDFAAYEADETRSRQDKSGDELKKSVKASHDRAANLRKEFDK